MVQFFFLFFVFSIFSLFLFLFPSLLIPFQRDKKERNFIKKKHLIMSDSEDVEILDVGQLENELQSKPDWFFFFFHLSESEIPFFLIPFILLSSFSPLSSLFPSLILHPASSFSSSSSSFFSSSSSSSSSSSLSWNSLYQQISPLFLSGSILPPKGRPFWPKKILISNLTKTSPLMPKNSKGRSSG